MHPSQGFDAGLLFIFPLHILSSHPSGLIMKADKRIRMIDVRRNLFRGIAESN